MSKIIFLSGLPRSGSTLLMNILGQNPNMAVSATSGLYELVSNARQTFTNSSTINASAEDIMNRRFRSACKEFIKGWADSEQKYYVDKSRGWPHFYEFLEHVEIEPKIIITVRDLRGVLTSFERLYRSNSLRFSMVSDGNQEDALTTDQRISKWGGGVPVGVAYNNIRDLFIRKVSNNVLFIRYEDLTKYPQQQLDKIYEYIDDEQYIHNFATIEQLTMEDDRLHGIAGLHTIESAMRPAKEDWDDILGPSLSNNILTGTPWFYQTFYPEMEI